MCPTLAVYVGYCMVTQLPSHSLVNFCYPITYQYANDFVQVRFIVIRAGTHLENQWKVKKGEILGFFLLVAKTFLFLVDL